MLVFHCTNLTSMRTFVVGNILRIKSEFKLVNILIKMLSTYLVIDTENTAFQDSPKGFDPVCVNVATNILFLAMIDTAMRIKIFFKSVVRIKLIRHYICTRRNLFFQNRPNSFLIYLLYCFSGNNSFRWLIPKTGVFVLVLRPCVPLVRLSKCLFFS